MQASLIMLTLDGCSGYDEENPFVDGGIVDRVGLKPWRDYCRTRPDLKPNPFSFLARKELDRAPDALVHLISRSSSFSGKDDMSKLGESRFSTFYSKKSGLNFFNMGDYDRQMMHTCEQASSLVDSVKQQVGKPRKLLVG